VAGLDVNRDGHRDIVGLGFSDGATLYTNDGFGGFPMTMPLLWDGSGGSSMRARDLDGDGYDDGVIGGLDGISVQWNVNGVLSPSPSFGPENDYIWYANAGDINHDGLGDVIASKMANSPTWLWHFDGQGNHAFAASKTYESYDVPETLLGTDLNRDGRDDIMLLHGGWLEAGVYLQGAAGMGAETLYGIPYATHYHATGLAVGDINGDGCTDAVVADYNNGLVVLYGHSCSDHIFADGLESAG
jgi:hypothetical protein